ncbi:hypothetical protein RDABS01_035380, partial [Bienertia sinuspersici]
MRSLRKRARKQVKVGVIKRCLTIMELKALLTKTGNLASRTRKSKKAVNALTLEKNTLALVRCAWQRYTWVHESLWPGKSITQHFKVKPSRLDLSQDLIEVKKKADQLIEEARKDAENARMEAEKPKKKQKQLGMMWIQKCTNNAIWEKKFHQLMNFIKGGTYPN